VGTGDKGEVFVVAPDGKGEVFYQNDERHARTLAIDQKAICLSAPSRMAWCCEWKFSGKPGTVPTAGAPFVIYETNKAKSLPCSKIRKHLYASSVGDKVRVQGAPRPNQPNTAPRQQPLPPRLRAA